MASLTTSDEELPQVGDVQTVLHALADPIRLEMVRRLASSADGQLNCGDLYDTISKSTASHHFTLLVNAGITRRVLLNGARGHRLRRDDLDEAMPGVLDSIMNAANSTD